MPYFSNKPRYRDEGTELWKILAAIFVVVPVVTTIAICIVATCYTVIWHVCRWVGWW